MVSEPTECSFSVSLRDIPNNSAGLAALVQMVSEVGMDVQHIYLESVANEILTKSTGVISKVETSVY